MKTLAISFCPFGCFYTPDGFWWNITQRNYARVCGTTRDESKDGGSCFALANAAGSFNWTVGASTASCLINTRQMRSGGIMDSETMPLPVVVLTIGFCAAVPACI